MIKKSISFGYTFDDLILVPAQSSVLPNQVDVKTRLTRNITMNIPIVSAAMDTVTESETAITMARQGGIGIIHKNMDMEKQALQVEKVKKSESGMIVDPITIEPDHKIYEVLDIMNKYRISGVPVVKDGNLVGIITNRDLKFGSKGRGSNDQRESRHCKSGNHTGGIKGYSAQETDRKAFGSG
jgi:IMP dehydrogenase